MKTFKQFLTEKYYETEEINSDVLEQASKNGYTIEAFHGSWERKLTKISKMKTSYGLFFSPDPITSSGYAGDSGKLYHVLLYNPPENKKLDLTDEMKRNIFFKEHFSSGKNILRSKEMNYYGDYDVLSDDDIRKKIMEEVRNNENIKKIIKTFLKMDENSEDDDIEFELDYSEIDDLLKIREISNIFNEYDIYDEQLADIHRLYNTNMQDFYMEYQDDMLKSAQSEGYEFVIFDDPATSSGGESISYVVFEPNHVKLADSETYDDNGEIIPLSQRFDSSKDDIRF